MSTQAVVVDLRSDTVTNPSNSMKAAMASADLGDDVYGEDPTANALEAKVAEMLGKEAALFVPSGTMANLIAAMVHCYKRGSEMLCGDQSHVFKREGGIAHLSGVHVTGLKNFSDGTFDLKDFEKHIRGSDIHEPVTMMVSIENTHSYCGGKVLPLDWIEKLASIAKKLALVVHMDGARLFNASEFLHVEPARIARDCDSVSVCFSKGLGAPIGSALAGTRRFIDQARRYRKMLGGGMRQVGVLAAAAMVGLEDSVPSLYADHRRAQYLAKGARGLVMTADRQLLPIVKLRLPGRVLGWVTTLNESTFRVGGGLTSDKIHNLKLPIFSVDIENQHTNIVHVKISDKTELTSSKIIDRLSIVSQSEMKVDCKTSNNHGIVIKASAKPDLKTIRFVLHRDINDEDLKLAVKKIIFVLKEVNSNK